MNSDDHRFPAGFLWGAATSAAQIEGAVDADGRGESIWDVFARQPGRIRDGSSPAVACDHYHRSREDIAAMQRLGLSAYRFSIAWPRVMPTGRGPVNEAGLDFYDRLVDALLAANLRPFVTLYHWDLPQALQEQGGWAKRSTVDAFVRYTEAVADRLGDRVPAWVTHNEPWCIAHLGHETGEQAPGHRDPSESLRVAHHLLLSHGRAVSALRERTRGEVGIVLNLCPASPATARPEDVEAAHRFDREFNGWYLDPLFRGAYPAAGIADRVRRGHLAAGPLPFVRAGDLAAISVPTDFLGVNYYSRAVLRAGPDGEPVGVAVAPPDELTDMGWEVYPRGLSELLLRIAREYGPKRLYVTENGAAYADGPDANDVIADRRRIEYLEGHLLAVHDAIAGGAPVHGYFVWSLLDNFEWSHGYGPRFGIHWVDFATGRRIPKASAAWYAAVVADNSLGGALQSHAARRSG